MKKLITLLFVLMAFTIPALLLQRSQQTSIPLSLSQSHVLEKLYDIAQGIRFSFMPLKGGLSGSNLYKADGNNKSYVIRLLGNNRSQESKEREISVQTIASEQGWGPVLYASDVDEGWIIMEYIKPTSLTQEDRIGDDLYISLAKRLRQIHTGPKFAIERDRLLEIQEKLDSLQQKDKIPQLFDYETLKNIVESIKKNRSAIVAPTHRDLNPGNIIFSGHEPFIIDFEDAAQDDPFFDLGVVGIFYVFSAEHEKLFLTAYFKHPFTQQEYMYYQNMKQLAYINYGLNLLQFAPYDVIKNTSIIVEPFEKMLQDFNNGLINVADPHDQLRLAVSFLDAAINQSKKMGSPS